MPHTLSTIPFEILGEILFYLDAETLKTLRQAIACRRMLAFTAQLLFQKFTIRLGARFHPIEKIEALLSKPPLSEPTESENGYGGILAYVRLFVLDTRYAIMLDGYSRDLEALTLGRNFLRQELPVLPSHVVRRQVEAMGTLVKVVEKMVTICYQLVEVRWLTSGSFNLEAHEKIASALSSAVLHKRYRFNVTLILNSVSKLQDYCPSLSNLHRVAVRIIQGDETPLDGSHGQLLAHIVLNSKDNLQHFMLDLQGLRTSLAGTRPLCGALEQATELKSLETYALGGFTLDLDFSNLTKLEHIASVQVQSWRLAGIQDDTEEDFLWEPDDESSYQYKLFQGITKSGARLKRVCVMNYGRAIHGFLMRNESSITQIDLFGFVQRDDEFMRLFWEDVVPKYSSSLKRIGVTYGDDKGPSKWASDPRYPAKLALSQCKNLETLKICCLDANLEPERSHIRPMIESLLVACPKLTAIYIDFSGRATSRHARWTRRVLGLPWECRWPEAEARALQGRSLDVIFEARSGPCVRPGCWMTKLNLIRSRLLPSHETDYFDEHYGMDLAYDVHLIIWQLSKAHVQGPKMFKFDQTQIYQRDDGSEKIWGAYEGFYSYL
ncbi:hypothetical protein TWF730_003602 [Orbilia blumenaviensis]|uniref:F-box domain-containing protein n=1 Tax=Orbilia blumenaviensis TaxID=1796055 RepID=A0AAV9U366_9PEZI